MSTAPRSAARTKSAAAPKPLGQRRPNPGLFWQSIRLAMFAVTILAVARPYALTWAANETKHSRMAEGPVAEQRTESLRPGLSLKELELVDLEAVTLRLIIQATYGNLLFSAAIRAIALINLALIFLELVLTLISLRLQSHRMRTMPVTYIRVRAPAPSSTQSRSGSSPRATGDQFFRAIQKEVIAFQISQRYTGQAPWAAFTLTGVPDAPVELGVVVAAQTIKERQDMSIAVRTVIQGQALGAQVEEHADFLAEALIPGTTVAWREFGLKLPVQFPIRFLEDIEGSDLLAPLAAALAPHGTTRTEAQIILRPANDWRLTVGWRGYATNLMLGLQEKADYALSEDVKTLEAKLDAPPFEVTLRIVTVAEGDGAGQKALDALDQIGKVLGQYAQRTSNHVQHFVVLHTCQISLASNEMAYQQGFQAWRAGAVRQLTDWLFQCGMSGTSASHAQRARQRLLARIPRFTPFPPIGLPFRIFAHPMILTSIEVAGLWHLPTAALAHTVRWLPCKFIPAEPHAYIPDSTPPLHQSGAALLNNRGSNSRIMVGMSHRADGTLAPVGPTLRDLRQILHLTAGIGTGKSRLLANICKQLIPGGYMLLDGKGDDQAGNLAMTMRQHIPLADEERLVILDVLDTEWPFGLNPMAGINLKTPGGVDQGLAQLLAVFARIDPETWGKSQGMQQYAKMAALLVLETEAYPTLAHVKQALIDDHYRARQLPACTNADVVAFWTVIYPRTGEQQKQSRDALLRRFDALLATETTRYMVTQPRPTLSLLEAIEGGMIVLVPMPEMTLGDLAGTIGMIVFQAVVRAAMSRAGNDQTRSTYAMVIDEFQVFVGTGDTSDVRKALTQLRSLGIAGIYAHQSLTQLGELIDEMLTNAASRIILKTQEPDASAYARQYAASGLTAADISGQEPNEHQYAVLQCDGKLTRIFSMQTLPWPLEEPILVEPITELRLTDWQRIIPADSPSPGLDQRICEIVYNYHEHWAEYVERLASIAEGDWIALLARWEAIRKAQRAHIIAQPGCIPDRLERQRWLSRLLACTPRVLAAAEYARIRTAIAHSNSAPYIAQDGKSGRDRATVSWIAPGIPEGSSPDRLQELRPSEPILGTAGELGEVLTHPAIHDTRSYEEALRERRRRRAHDEISPDYDDLA